ncbi:Cytochrome c oxidase subunit 5B, mitochondrial [Elasticomyces elasticus]|nr:Cytochrome c oxidase subunit 5B, mitochondrial [Elasticomyces elasticus]
MFRSTALLRQLPTSTTRLSPRLLSPAVVGQVNVQQSRKAHAISNPTLANIEKRWEGMPPQEQADLWMALRDRMKEDWTALTVQEKKAGMFNHSKFTRISVLWCPESAGEKLLWQRHATAPTSYSHEHHQIPY